MTNEQLQELLQKEKAGLCTPEEQARLLQWYEQLDVTGSLYIEDEPVEAVAVLSETMLQDFRQRLAKRQAPIRKMRVWRVVAAAVVFMVFGLWFLVGRRQSGKPPIVETPVMKDIQPGGDRAMLQLADGSAIVLDSAGNGVLKQDGDMKVVKLRDGELAYDRQSSIVNRQSIQYNTLRTPKGGQYQLTLPDGTKVWLNAASSIRFPTSFDAKERAVAITGEVYFEVAKDKAKPFIVDVDGKSTVEVLGTHFNINAYDDEPAIRTTLIEGKVKVVNRQSSIGHEQSVVLQPGEQAIYSRFTIDDSRLTIDHSPDIDEVTAWKNGLFKYQEADIQTILRQAARWYDVEVVYEGTVTTEKFRGTIGRHVKLSEFLRILELNNIHFEIQGKKIIVRQ